MTDLKIKIYLFTINRFTFYFNLPVYNLAIYNLKLTNSQYTNFSFEIY